MAHPDHVRHLEGGVQAWDDWRSANPEATPDLTGAVLHGRDLSGVRLASADLRGADLRGADLTRAQLNGARMGEARLDAACLDAVALLGADLRGAFLVNASLRGAHLTLTDLRGANLEAADLTDANLALADLRSSNLERAKLRDASLVCTRLDQAQMQGCDLVFATLRGARLSHANLWYADLTHANLKSCDLLAVELAGAGFGWTVLSDLDLSQAHGLQSVRHDGPSTVGVDTLERTAGGLGGDREARRRVETFLRGAGTSEVVVAAFHTLTKRPVELGSCFVSHAAEDRLFARKLAAALHEEGVRCWFDEHRMLPGEEIFDRVERELRPRDRVVLCVSRTSLASWWLADEVTRTLQREQELDRRTHVLVVVDLDGFLREGGCGAELRSELEARVVADASGWSEDPARVTAASSAVVAAVRAEG